MRMIAKTVLFCVVLGVVSLSSVGCGPNRKMAMMNVETKVDSTVGRGGVLPTMDVDLVGVKQDDFERWRNVDMDKYWQAQSPLRAAAKESIHTMTFGEGQPTSQKLPKTHPIWNKWKANGAKYLFVLANLPGAHANLPGDQDARRRILPLERYRWNGDQITITVFPTGAQTAPPTNPEKK